ncbi:carbamoyltransferase [Paenibacillus allorhizosphaerae]|uniref:carbamoyltransferase family protein n=2 Tax=Paenibacillus allorhizosphaerae TaxID=2849866 RepID=UPI00360DEBFA
MLILGVGGSSHDYSACLVEDGNIKVAIEDERITRIKHSRNLGIRASKSRAVYYCLDTYGKTLDDVDLIVGNDLLDLNPAYYYRFRDRIILINHHLSHACSAFFVSPYENAAILIVDGHGSMFDTSPGSETLLTETITYYYGEGNNITEIKKINSKMKRVRPTTIEDSIGRFYQRLGTEIGFPFTEEGKTMGLAPYGTTKYVDEFSRYYSMDGEGNFKQTFEQKNNMIKFISNELLKAENNDVSFQIKADVAYAGQYHLEQAIIKAANFIYQKTKCKNLCLAGGVALNSVANFKILENTPFENIFIQPAAGDAGTSIGSALYGHYVIKGNVRSPASIPFSPYLGKLYKDSDIIELLKEYSSEIFFQKPEDIYTEVSKLISEGNIIGWFNGRSEIGPRSLGNRSILADARNRNMKNIINERIKHREMFRPFAPVVLEEKQSEYFDLSHPSYYMLLVPPIHVEKRNIIPSVVHVDGTGRVQTVNKDLNPQLHSLLTAFYNITNVPVLLNTSFNDNGEPIVETPKDALQCFLKIDLDYLIMGNYLIKKKSV